MKSLEAINKVLNNKQLSVQKKVKQIKEITNKACTSFEKIDYITNVALDNPDLTELDKIRMHNDKKDIEKDLKAFEIIRNKVVDISLIIIFDDVNKYNECQCQSKRKLTKDQFDLLKEQLK